jgi:hypothetical protein
MATAAVDYHAITNLTRDLKKATVTLSRDEARFLVDNYYLMQEQRIRTAGQVRSMNASGEPHDVLHWFNAQSETLEKQVAKALDAYSNGFVLGRWARSQYGIGPVISAGLLAHIDIEKAPTVGHIWSFAGLNPTAKWEKGQKRPWNAELKTLCWKLGESFLKTSGRDGDVYGHILMERRTLEQERNDKGEYAEQAATSLKRVGKTTETAKHNEDGKLSPGHILSRSKRYAVKLFLAHYHHVAYELKFGTLPPKPYIIEHGGHTHYLAPPNWPMAEKVDGLKLVP